MDFTEFVMSNYKKCFFVLFFTYFILISIPYFIMNKIFSDENESLDSDDQK